MGHCHGLLSRDVLAKIFEFGQESVTWIGISIPHRQDCVWPKVGPFSFRALTRKGHIEKRGLKWKGSSPSVQNTKHHHTQHRTQHQNQNQPPTPTEPNPILLLHFGSVPDALPHNSIVTRCPNIIIPPNTTSKLGFGCTPNQQCLLLLSPSIIDIYYYQENDGVEMLLYQHPPRG